MFRSLAASLLGGVTLFGFIRYIVYSSEESTFAAFVSAAIAVIIIIGLAIYYKSAADNLRLAGDNIYYLGLLYTLSSLIIALLHIFVFQQEDDDLRQRTHDLIGNFGIALISTIAGIMGRIWLHSVSDMKVSYYQRNDVELEKLELSVSDSMMALRRTLREANDAFGHFTRVTQNQAEQTRAHSEILIRDFNDRMSTEVERGLSETMTRWAESLDAIAAAGKKLVIHFDREVSATILQTETAWRGLGEEVATVAKSSRLQLASDAAEISRILDRVAAMSDRLDSLAAGLADAEDGARSLGVAVVGAATNLDNRAVEIVDAYNTLVQGAREFEEVGLAKCRDAISDFMRVARGQLEQEGEKWLQSVTAVTESAELQLKRASDKAEVTRLVEEGISEGTERSLALVEQITRSLERAVRNTEALSRSYAAVTDRGRWI